MDEDLHPKPWWESNPVAWELKRALEHQTAEEVPDMEWTVPNPFGEIYPPDPQCQILAYVERVKRGLSLLDDPVVGWFPPLCTGYFAFYHGEGADPGQVARDNGRSETEQWIMAQYKCSNDLTSLTPAVRWILDELEDLVRITPNDILLFSHRPGTPKTPVLAVGQPAQSWREWMDGNKVDVSELVEVKERPSPDKTGP